MRIRYWAAFLTVAICVVQAQTDWPVYGHDPGGMRFSPLKQINPKNVSKLQVAWTYDTVAPVSPTAAPAPPPAEAGPGRGSTEGSAAAGGAPGGAEGSGAVGGAPGGA